jgi:hypothetical protein
MSERITDARFNEIWRKAYPTWTSTDKKVAWLEANRARFEEARLTNEVAETVLEIEALSLRLTACEDRLRTVDARGKALADALGQHGEHLDCAVCGGNPTHRPVSGIWYCVQGPTALHPDVAHALRLAKVAP